MPTQSVAGSHETDLRAHISPQNRKLTCHIHSCFHQFHNKMTGLTPTFAPKIAMQLSQTIQLTQKTSWNILGLFTLMLYSRYNSFNQNELQAKLFRGTAAVFLYRCCNHIETNAL
jgi:hypothetical protein